MDQPTLSTIQKLLEQLLAKPDGVVLAAMVTVGGMLGVAIVGAMIQWIVTRTVTRSEHERIRIQLQSESRLRRTEQWHVRFQETIADLLKETDPEVNPEQSSEKVVPLILRAQLMLSPKEPAHSRLLALITELGLVVNGWHGTRDVGAILRIHGELLDAAREILALPTSE